MANFITVNGEYPCYDPRQLAGEAARLGLPNESLGLANSVSCPRGMEPGVAWLLMIRSDLDEIKSSSSNLNDFISIEWASDYDQLSMDAWLFHKATCMSPSENEKDPDALYLVQLLDKRWLLGMSATNSSHYQYNCRCPAPPATSGAKLYYNGTLNSGSVWTWQTMLDDLWSLLPSSIRGSSPTLPYTPNGTPENFRFVGISAWEAIGRILNKIQVELVYDPEADHFSYVRLGTTQAGLTSALVNLQSRLIHDYWPIEANLSRFPEKIRVCFPTFIANFGSDADVAQGPVTGTNFAVLPAYTVDINTGITGALGGTLITIWDDMVAVFSGNASGDPQNSTALNSRATEVAGNWVNTVQTSDTRARKFFTGLTTKVSTGSQIDRVVWRDFGDGVVTEIISSPSPKDHGQMSDLVPYDVGRRVLEDYPDKAQVVQLTGLSATNNLFPGKVVRFPPEGTLAAVTDEAVWVGFPNEGASPKGTNYNLSQYWYARLVGTIDNSGTIRPVYLVTEGIYNAFGQITSDIPASLGGTGTVELYDSNYNDLSKTINPVNLSDFSYKAGSFVNPHWDPIQRQWYIPDITAVFTGTVATASIAAGATGSVNIQDDQYNTLFTKSAVRALSAVVLNDKVLVAYDYHNAEFFCWPQVTPPIAQSLLIALNTLNHGDATATGTKTYFNGPAPTGTVTVNNTLNFSMVSGGHGIAILRSYTPASGDATYELVAVNMTEWNNYTAGNVQFLGHDTSGNSKWYDIKGC